MRSEHDGWRVDDNGWVRHPHLSEGAWAAVLDAMEERVAVGGSQAAKLEAEVAVRFDLSTRQVLATSSCTHAIELAGVGIQCAAGQGSVIVPAHTYVGSVSGLLREGLELCLVDVNPVTLATSPYAVERHLANCPRRHVGLMAVHLYGAYSPGQTSRLLDIARANHLLFIEDFCQAPLVAPPSGHFAAFSLNACKPWGGLQGGLLCVGNPTVADDLRTVMGTGNPAESTLGCSYQIAETSAALAIHQMGRGFAAYQRRASNLANLRLADSATVRWPLAPVDGTHLWHKFVVETPDPAALAAYCKNHGIPTARWMPTPLWQWLGNRSDVTVDQIPNAREHCERALVIGDELHPLAVQPAAGQQAVVQLLEKYEW